MTAIVNFDSLPAPSASAPAADRVRSGDPRQLIWNLLSSADGRFHVGQWASGVGEWEVQYTEFELWRPTARPADTISAMRASAASTGLVTPSSSPAVFTGPGK